MDYTGATIAQLDEITNLVQHTIQCVYPNYYPKEVVAFFCALHSKENIRKDIECGHVGVLMDQGQLIGTGSYQENHITRVYVDPNYQKQGYGSYIMRQLEHRIAQTYETAVLDASLPASHLYESLGYQTLKHERWELEHGVVLVYEIMQKHLNLCATSINYDGRVFTTKMNTENGEVDDHTIFTYHQMQDIVWAAYCGGEIIKGFLIGTVADQGELDFTYQHINQNKQVRIGKCHSIPIQLENGKLELHETWQWLNQDESKGSSIVMEQ